MVTLVAVDARGDDPRTAADAIRAAVVERLGDGVDVTIIALDIQGDAPAFREARPDPSARLGKPIRFTLVTMAGGAMTVIATLSVTADHVVVRRRISRGATVTPEDVSAERGVLQGLPLRPLPIAEHVIGARALRPIDAGAIVLQGFVLAPRAVEPGDRVTLSAAAGPVEVTASVIAVDGGRIGDTIRVRNPESRTFLRGRILRRGYLEVVHGR